MFDNLFEGRLGKNNLLPLDENGDRLLAEASYFSPLMGLKNILFHIKSKGYYSVLAHPGRYAHMDGLDYRQLRDMDVRFQINLPSVAGTYGNRIEKKVMFLMREQATTYIGTDIHNYNIFQKFIYMNVTRGIQKLLDLQLRLSRLWIAKLQQKLLLINNKVISGEKAPYHLTIEQLRDKKLSDSQKDNFVKKLDKLFKNTNDQSKEFRLNSIL